MSVIQIKRTTTSTVPTSNSGGASSTIDAGELTYSYAAGDGSGDESGVGKLFIVSNEIINHFKLNEEVFITFNESAVTILED